MVTSQKRGLLGHSPAVSTKSNSTPLPGRKSSKGTNVCATNTNTSGEMVKGVVFIIVGLLGVMIVGILLYIVLKQPMPTPPNPPNPPNKPSIPLSPLIIPSSVLNKWSNIAQQGGIINLPSQQLVRYGSLNGIEPHWAYKTLQNGTCDVATFGIDPNFGTVKHCEVKKSIIIYALVGIRITDTGYPNGQYFNFIGTFGDVKTGDIVVARLTSFDTSISPQLKALMMQYINDKSFVVQLSLFQQNN